VFLIATHASARPETLEYYKLGSGPYYTIVRNNIFVHLEIMKTVRRMLEGGDVLLHNSSIPKTSLGAITKRDLRAGTRLSEAIGSFDLRGHAIHMDDHPDHVPIGLLRNSVVTKDLAAGSLVRVDAVELEDSLAVRLWKEGKTSPTSSTEEVGPIRAPDSLSEDDARSPRA
jgi:predicted homoserine dehydrogenase-like protein